MKAEHRKELHTNALADRLGKTFQSMKEGPSRNTVLVGGLVLLALALVFSWRYFAASARENDSARWLRWDTLFAPKHLETFADDKEVQGTSQARLALFQLARLQLHQGLRDLGSSRARARESITKATRTYEKLVDESRDVPLLQQEALLCAAKGYESLGDLQKARTLYDRLAQEHPRSACGREATESLKRLTDESARKELEDLAREFGEQGEPAGKTGS